MFIRPALQRWRYRVARRILVCWLAQAAGDSGCVASGAMSADEADGIASEGEDEEVLAKRIEAIDLQDEEVCMCSHYTVS